MEPSEEFSWEKLGCPSSICTERVKQKLNKGLHGILWNELSKLIRPTSEVAAARKQILLHKLRVGAKDAGLESIKSLPLLKTNRDRLNEQINNTEEEWNKRDTVTSHKVQELKRKKESRESLQLKKNILTLKLNELEEDTENLKKGQTILDYHLPPSNAIIDESVIDESVNLVCALATGADKQEGWNSISSLLGSIQIPVLFDVLTEIRSRNNQSIIDKINGHDASFHESAEKCTIDSMNEMYTQHVRIECRKRLHMANFQKQQYEMMHYIDAIDRAISEQSPESCEWLTLAISVRKNENFCTSLEKGLMDLGEYFSQNSLRDTEYRELRDTCRDLDFRVNECMQQLQESLVSLKNAGLVINVARKKMALQLENLASLQLEFRGTDWFDHDISRELSLFTEQMSMQVFRKIMLKGKAKDYSHLSRCIAEAGNSVTMPQSHHSSSALLIRAPIYHLLECYKAFVVKFMLEKRESNMSFSLVEELKHQGHDAINFHEMLECMEKSQHSDASIDYSLNRILKICGETNDRILETKQILDLWLNQPLQEVIFNAFEEVEVNGANLKQWLQRYTMLIYQIQRSKKQQPNP